MEQITQFNTILLITTIRYFVMAGGAFLIFYFLFPKQFSRNKIQSRWAKNKDFIREILHSMQTSIIIAIVGLVFLFTDIRPYTLVYDQLETFPIWWVPVSVILALIIHDTYFYWMHRFLHHPRWYKKIHLVHHQSINPSPWASYSFHFIEGVTEAMILPVILFILPMHPMAIGLFGLSAFVINVYGHLGFEIAPKWLRHSFLFEILNTSVYHNLHHEKFKGNYGLYFRVWDRLMKTEHPDYVKTYDAIQARRFGEKNMKLSGGTISVE